MDKNLRRLLASSLVINLFQKGSMFLDEVSRWRNEFMIISEFSDIALLSSQCRLRLLSHKIKQNSVVFGWQYSARLATAQPSPAQPSPAPLALGSNVIANLNIFIWHFMFSNGHNNLCLRILLIQRQRNGNSSHQMCIAWILEMLSAAHPCFTGHSAFPIKWITSTV